MKKPFSISKKGFTARVAINNITSNEIRVLHFSSDDDLHFFCKPSMDFLPNSRNNQTTVLRPLNYVAEDSFT